LSSTYDCSVRQSVEVFIINKLPLCARERERERASDAADHHSSGSNWYNQSSTSFWHALAAAIRAVCLSLLSIQINGSAGGSRVTGCIPSMDGRDDILVEELCIDTDGIDKPLHSLQVSNRCEPMQSSIACTCNTSQSMAVRFKQYMTNNPASTTYLADRWPVLHASGLLAPHMP
jgi:hypothetical protein